MGLFVALLTFFIPLCLWFEREIIGSSLANLTQCALKAMTARRLTISGHRKHRARFKFPPIPILPARFGVFQGTYMVHDCWAYIFGLSLYLTFDNYLYELCLLGSVLLFRKAPPWLVVWGLVSLTWIYDDAIHGFYVCYLVTKSKSWNLYSGLGSIIGILGYHRVLCLLDLLERFGASSTLGFYLESILDGFVALISILEIGYANLLIFRPPDFPSWSTPQDPQENYTVPDTQAFRDILDLDYKLESLALGSLPSCIPVSPVAQEARFRNQALTALEQSG